MIEKLMRAEKLLRAMLSAMALCLTAVAQPAPAVPLRLSVQDAEALALKNNPQISVARLDALASHQVTREVRSALLPNSTINLTAVDSHEDSRISAGGLNNPIIYERGAGGATVSQLITDFGRTTNLLASSKFHAKAQDQTSVATAEQIILAVDNAFYAALRTASVLTVAQETVNTRQTVVDQVDALAKAKLKSDLDLSFANVNLAQAKLLLLDAQNSHNAALAALSAILGFSNQQPFELVQDTEPFTPPQENVDQLIADGLAKRPEIAALDYESQAAEKFRVAERDLQLPNIRALGTVGQAPVRNDHLSSWFGAVGVNMEIPVFNGFLFSARAREAQLRSQAATERLRDLRNTVARDIRTSWLEANTAYNRLSVTKQLLDQANLALDLAQTRYKLGLGSIVELSQAQLQQTQAQIAHVEAGYQYRYAQAVLRFETAGR